jgi:cbb3-type cytochrome oxidase subunit 3
MPTFSISKFKFIFTCLLLVLSFLMVAQAVLAAVYNPQDPAQSTGLNTAAKGYGVNTGILYPEGGLPTIIGRIIGAVLSFLGVVFFGIILYAGIGWITSMGKEEKINEAKDMIIAAVLGLIIVLGAYAITNIVAQIFTTSTGIPR